MNGYYPNHTAVTVKLDQLFRARNDLSVSERMSTHMVKCASELPKEEFVGWQILVPVKGKAAMTVFGTASLAVSDLEWITEKMAITKTGTAEKISCMSSLGELYELYLPVSEKQERRTIGFGAVSEETGEDTDAEGTLALWPASYSSQFSELVKAFRITGACFRALIGKADQREREVCRKNTHHTWQNNGIDPEFYIGQPVKARFLVRLPGKTSIRLMTVLEEAIPGVTVRYLGSMDGELCRQTWDDPLKEGALLPDLAARIMLLEPVVHEIVPGIEQCEEPVKKIPASHKNTAEKGAVEIGKAEDIAGLRRKITIGEMDLKRHYQIIGQTGTGKSTLLANIILDAIKKGHGLTFFDPHGSTIDMVLRSVPEKYAGRIRVVRIGDAENPVPLRIWDSGDPEKEERNINDLCELFSDIFDPNKEGFVGPRYERWLSIFAKASIALLGERASLESITVLSQNRASMRDLYDAISPRYPELADIIRYEYINDRSNDFESLLSWLLCKFQRLTSVEQLRKTLGAGANALDFVHTIDTDAVTLIDLASPVIGTHAARIIGTLLLMKLWNAVMARKKREKTHLVVVDEAALFQTNPMPRMLAESRKFGLSMVLSHQHTGQLTTEIRDALEANSANFSAFRLSPKDAVKASVRFDIPDIETMLTRLDVFRAITTISVNGKQSAPFTLEIERPRMTRDHERIAAEIEQASIDRLVKPYQHLNALTAAEIRKILQEQAKKMYQEESLDVYPDILEDPYWEDTQESDPEDAQEDNRKAS